MNNSRLKTISIAVAAIAVYFAVVQALEVARISRPLPAAAQAAPGDVDVAALLDDVRTLAAPAFEGRRTGTAGSRKAQAYLLQRFQSLGLTPFGAGYAQPFSFTHHSFRGLFAQGKTYQVAYPQASNIVGYIRGSAAPRQYLVVSAHYDHLGVQDGQVYPGADDNASGVAAMLAIAAQFKRHPPLHTIVFAAFDAEELGLRGSRAFLAALPFPQDGLRMNLNLDMLAHNDSNQIFVAGTHRYGFLAPYVAQAAGRSTLQVLPGHDRPQLIAGLVEDWTDSSDHGPFHQAGIPFLYFGVADHPDHHRPSDTFEHINQPFFGKVAALVVDLAGVLDRNLEQIRR